LPISHKKRGGEGEGRGGLQLIQRECFGGKDGPKKVAIIQGFFFLKSPD